MNATKTLSFQCPHCGQGHEKHIDVGVYYAEIHFRCSADAGGCDQRMIVFYGDHFDMFVHPVKNAKRIPTPAEAKIE